MLVHDNFLPHHDLVDQYGFNSFYSLTATISFGGLENTAFIAGDQGQHPWCGVHSLGNLVQESCPGTGEWVNDYILRVAKDHGGLHHTHHGDVLNIEHYQPILANVFHIPCHWEVFTPERAKELLDSNHGILVIGEADCLNPHLYGHMQGFHAFNLTDIKIDEHGNTWFKGLDSNVPHAESWWSSDAVQQSLAKGHEQFGNNMLVTDQMLNWPWKNT